MPVHQKHFATNYFARVFKSVSLGLVSFGCCLFACVCLKIHLYLTSVFPYTPLQALEQEGQPRNGGTELRRDGIGWERRGWDRM